MDEQGRTRTDNLWRRKPTRCHCATHPSRCRALILQKYVVLPIGGKIEAYLLLRGLYVPNISSQALGETYKHQYLHV